MYVDTKQIEIDMQRDSSDLFKPLYKLHKNETARELCFDTHNPVSRIGTYSMVHHSPVRGNIEQAYKAYDLTAPTKWAEWTCPELPGLRVITGITTKQLQRALVLEATEGEYLASNAHLTNLDAHYPDLKRPIDIYKWTDSRSKPQLRWVTLGGQYNWTDKVYPSFELGSETCPLFPERLQKFMYYAFGINAQAAIVNYYSPGDTLSPHQDVAELCDKDLISLSLGCSCVFYVGLKRKGLAPLPIILHSGDIVVMGGEARYAFHGVGRVWSQGSTDLELEDTLQQWINKKRVNINVRQMVQ